MAVATQVDVDDLDVGVADVVAALVVDGGDGVVRAFALVVVEGEEPHLADQVRRLRNCLMKDSSR